VTTSGQKSANPASARVVRDIHNGPVTVLLQKVRNLIHNEPTSDFRNFERRLSQMTSSTRTLQTLRHFKQTEL
jgi:hypothetical protein